MIENDSQKVFFKIVKWVVIVHFTLTLAAFVPYKLRRKPKKVYDAVALKERMITLKPAISKPSNKTKSSPKRSSVAKKSSPKRTQSSMKPVVKKEALTLKPLPNTPPSGAKSELELKLPRPSSELDTEKNANLNSDSFDPLRSGGAYEHYFKRELISKFQLKAKQFIKGKITIDSEGRVVSAISTEASDELIKDFVLENIKKMRFSPFFGERSKDSAYVYVIYLKGEEL